MNLLTEILRNIISIIKEIIFTFLSSALLPLLEVFQELVNNIREIFEIEQKLISKIQKAIQRNLKSNIYFSLAIYYIILVSLEIIMLVKLLNGMITYYDISILISFTFLVLLFSFVFSFFLNKHFKTSKFSYLIYFQLLFLLPIVMTHWIANIEGHNIYLQYLNSDQWISIFNTVIIYFSGCLIGIVTLYKTNEANRK